jgi:hypothetical protein
MAKSFGLICFSVQWSNPVLWSHYGDRHAGIALGFEMPDAHLKKVDYAVKRAKSMLQGIIANIKSGNAEEEMQKLLFTKYHHWRYEAEMRCFLRLDPSTVESGNYFAEFSDSMQLREVIVGAMSDATRDEVSEVIAGLHSVEAFKARLAFNTFRVVKNRNQSLWT